MPKLSGTFETKQGKKYGYEATWSASGPVILWNAKVRYQDRLVAVPTGEFRLEQGNEVDAAVRRDVEWAIEHRLSLNDS